MTQQVTICEDCLQHMWRENFQNRSSKTSVTAEDLVYFNLFIKRPKHTWDYSHAQVNILLSACTSEDVGGGKEHSLVSHSPVHSLAQAHDIENIQFM